MQKDIFNWKAVKRMKALGVDEAAEEAYKREKEAGCVRFGRVDIVTLTENWLFYDSGLSTALFPLKEIEFFKKDYTAGRGYVSFFVRLMFKDGGKYNLPCDFEQLDELAAALAERCPQANTRPWGTYR